MGHESETDCIAESTKYKKLKSVLFVSSVLLFATFVAFPHQAAQAHQSGWHEFCWESTLTFFDFLIDIANKFKWLFGPGIVILATIVAVALGIAFVNVCPPQLIPPPQTTTKAVALECNAFEDTNGDGIREPGFRAKSTTSNPNSAKDVDFLTTGKFTSSVTYNPTATPGDPLVTKDLPNIHYVNVLIPFMSIMIPAAVGKALDLIPGLSFLKKFFINLIVGLLFGFFDYKFALSKFDQTKQDGSVAHAAFGFRVNNVEFNPKLDKFFPLGTNEIDYIAKTNRQDDTATFYFNVLDTERPRVIFEQPTIVLEANSHFGFTVDSISLKELGNVSVIETCKQDAQPEYIGKKFFPLTKIVDEKSQLAMWYTEDQEYPMYEIDPNAMKVALESLSKEEIQQYQIDIEKRNNMIDDLKNGTSADAEAVQALTNIGISTGFATGKTLAKQALSKSYELTRKATIVDHLIETNQVDLLDQLPSKRNKLLKFLYIDDSLETIKDLFEETVPDKAKKVFGKEEFRKPKSFNDLDEQLKKAVKELKATEAKAAVKKGIGKDLIKGLGGKLVGVGIAAGATAISEAISGAPGEPSTIQQPPHSEIFGQVIFVNDTIAPDIFIPRHVALEVNKTDPSGGCSDVGGEVMCDLTVNAPLVFDIADPFPKLEHNFTDTGDFEELFAPKLEAEFPLGVTNIAWKATDFSGNISDEVILIVNVKQIGTNKVSVAQNQTVSDAFYDIPKDITVNATNADRDPLQFLIAQNPDQGIIESPIEAVFQNKFQKEGIVSRLTGITNDPSENFEDKEVIFFSDAENQRVMKINSSSNMLDLAFNATEVTSRPEGIAMTGAGTFMISDWKNNTIIEAQNDNGKGTVKERFDVSGLFVEPRNISVDRSTGDIYVTDKANGTITRLANFTIFDSPSGLGISPSNEVYVVDTDNYRISIFNTSGIFLDKFGSEVPGSSQDEFDSPHDVTVDPSGNIYVSDTNNDRISKFDSDHTFVEQFGPTTSGNSYLDSPIGVEFNGTDIFVADTGNNRIQKINANYGSFLFIDNYNANSSWVAVPPAGSTVTVDDVTAGSVRFDSTPSGNAAVWHGVNRTITMLPNDAWRADFDVITGTNTVDSNAFVWLVTNDTKHPSNNPEDLDAISAYLDNNELKIYQEHAGINTTSVGISIADNTKYYVTLERLNSTAVALGIFNDTNRLTHVIGSPIVQTIDQSIASLQVLQHTNDFSNGADPIDLELDNTIITSLFNWLGKCTSGPSCDTINNKSRGFECTDTTCAGLSLGSNTGQFDRPSGIALNTTHIFVADTDNHRIQIFDASGSLQQTLGTGTAGNAAGQFNGPTDVDQSPFGTIFVVDTQNDRIQAFDKFGNFVFEEGTSGDGDGQFDHPKAIALDNLGKIYVADVGNNRIQQFESDGNFLDKWKSAINSHFKNFMDMFTVSLTELVANAIDLDSFGNIFVGDWTSGKQKIVKLSRNAGAIPEFDVSSSVLDPKNIAINSTNFIFVTDSQTNSIEVFDNKVNFEQSIDLAPLGIQPFGITIDQNDIIHVSDWNEERILTLDVTGGAPVITNEFNVTTLFTDPKDIASDDTFFWITHQDGDAEKILQIRKDKGITDQFDFIGPPTATNAITLGKADKADTIFYANASNGRILNIDSNTDTITELVDLIATEGITPNAIAVNPVLTDFVVVFANITGSNLAAPTGLAFGGDGNLYVSSAFTKSIKRFNGTSGDYIDDFVSDERLQFPRDLIFDKNGTLYVSDSTANNIIRYNGTGEFIDIFASGGGLQAPLGITFGDDDNLYVSNSALNNILYFNGTTGQRIGQFVNTTHNGGLLSPQSLAFGPDGNLYVASFLTDSIKKYDGTTGLFISDFIKGPEISRPTGLTFDLTKEKLVVSSFTRNKILEYNVTTAKLIGEFALGQVDHPQDLTFGNDGKLYLSSMGTDEILRIGMEPVKFFVGDWNTKLIHGLAENGTVINVVADIGDRTDDPQYIATDSTGDIWIAYSNATNGRLENLKGSDGSLIEVISLTDMPLDTPDTTTMVMTGNDTAVEIDEQTGQIIEPVEIPTTSIIPQGIDIDSDDHIYVTDWNNYRIIELDISGNLIDQFKVNSTFWHPMDIAVSSIENSADANIFVADAGSGNITKIQTDLLFREANIQENVTSINGIAFNNGSIFFTSPPEPRILEINATGDLHEISDVFVEPDGISVAGPNSIFVSDWNNERIVEFNSTGHRIGEPYDMSPARFLEPSKLRDIEVEPGIPPSFWVADARTATISMLKPGDQFDFEAASSVADKFIMGSGIAVDSQENFILASTSNNTLIKFDEAGTLLTNRTFAAENMLKDVWSAREPISGEDIFYLALRMPDKIIKMNSALEDINSTSLNFAPSSVAVDTDGNIFVSGENNVIRKFDDSFNFIQGISIPNGGSISDIAIDNKNNLFASDFAEHRIHKINATSGSFIGWLGKCDSGSQCNLNQEHSRGFKCTEDPAVCDIVGKKKGFGAGQFFQPTDVAVDRLGNLYVADLQVKPRDMNAPRIQKFSNNGFFIENTLSDTTKTRIKGNFNLPKAIAVGSFNFFVLDNKTLHVFDVNPFSPIQVDSITNVTSSDVTYKANFGFTGFDFFKFMVDDGFDQSNEAIVNVTVGNPDNDHDNIFFDIDIEGNPEFSNDFSDVPNEGRTSGTIVDRGGQVLVIRDAKDSEKGVFIQADITPINSTRAEISACNNSTTIFLNEGTQIFLTCGIPTIEVVRGEVDANFFDVFGRNGTVTIPIFEKLSFDPVDYRFISGDNNEETLSVNIQFNNMHKIYSVPPNDFVVIDKAPPDIDSVCPNPINLEAEIITGVNKSNTNLGGIIDNFLHFTAPDVDDGIPNMTTNKPIPVKNNAPDLLPLNFTTKVTFTAIDDVGNIATCDKIITVEDTTPPDITFPAILNNKIDVVTPSYNDAAVVNFDTGEARDLPPKLGDLRPLINSLDKPINCFPRPDYAFPIGRHSVYCQIADDSAIVGRANFTINVTPGPDVFIKNLTASDTNDPANYSDGDSIIVRFSQDTNKPAASTKSEIDSLFVMSQPIGINYTGTYTDAATLVINIMKKAVAPPTVGVATFAINASSGLTNAAGTIGASAMPTTLGGSFGAKASPFISALIADDPEPVVDNGEGDEVDPLDDIEYSVGDRITIRFSEPTNRPGGTDIMNKDNVDKLFSFPGYSLGDDYQGRWLTTSTFGIKILELNTNVALDPKIGSTTAVVKANGGLKDSKGISSNSTSRSAPLSGSFGAFSVAKKVSANNAASTVLPSGTAVEILVPQEVRSLGITRNDDTSGNIKFLGNVIDVVPSEKQACDSGCMITFTFQKGDLQGVSPSSISIFHDQNNDGIIEIDESLDTVVEEISTDVFTAKATIFSTSLIGFGAPKSGGGGGDVGTAPRFTTQSITGNGVLVTCPDDINALCQGAVLQDVIQLTNSMPTAKIETGKPVRFSMLLYENSGIQGLDHISLYMNLRGMDRAIYQSDTFIRLHQGQTIISDPHGFFQSAEISLIPRGNLIEAAFDVTFAEPMELSDLIFRAWDHKLNSRDAKFLNAIEIIEPQTNVNTDVLTIVSAEQSTDESSLETIVPKDILNMWAGFSSEVISDSEILDMLGLEGDSIPSWYKEIIIEGMIKRNIISQEEMLNALTFFYDNGFLENDGEKEK